MDSGNVYNFFNFGARSPADPDGTSKAFMGQEEKLLNTGVKREGTIDADALKMDGIDSIKSNMTTVLEKNTHPQIIWPGKYMSFVVKFVKFAIC